MANTNYDFLIIGSGSAAFAAAIEAVSQGAKVAMVEKDQIGGTCVNIGCVPSKTLIKASEFYYNSRYNPFDGIKTSSNDVDYANLINQKDELVSKLRKQKYIDLIDEYGFDIIKGEACFIDHKTIKVNEKKYTAKSFLIATGASPFIPAIPGLKEVNYLTSTTAFEIDYLPEKIAIIGAGYIALELGNLFSNLGCQVTLMRRSKTLMKGYDPEIDTAVNEFLVHKGIEVITGVSYNAVKETKNIKKIYINQDNKDLIVEADEILVAAGRRPNTKVLDLDKAGIKIGVKGEVIVDQYLQTSNSSIYAAGDVIRGPQFVYVAAREGKYAAENAVKNLNRELDLNVVPAVIFTHPSIATVGLTAEQAEDKGFKVNSLVLPLESVPRAMVNHETTGVFKLIINKDTQEILGVHIVAENAGDIIYAGTLAVKHGLTVRDIKETFAPYLTMAEGIKLAALSSEKDISKLSCCAG